MEYRSKGYGTEAVKTIIQYGFNNLGLERITANTLTEYISPTAIRKDRFHIRGQRKKSCLFCRKQVG